jgi:hypothetical protein
MHEIQVKNSREKMVFPFKTLDEISILAEVNELTE